MNIKFCRHTLVKSLASDLFPFEDWEQVKCSKNSFFVAFFGLDLFCIVFYTSNYISCEVFMLVSYFARLLCLQTGLRQIFVAHTFEP